MIDPVNFVFGVKIFQMLGQLLRRFGIVSKRLFHDQGNLAVAFATIVGNHGGDRFVNTKKTIEHITV